MDNSIKRKRSGGTSTARAGKRSADGLDRADEDDGLPLS
jgi:hypothetical protein